MSTDIQIQVEPQSWPITGGFRISRGAKTHAEVLVVTLTDGNTFQGRGECVPYARYGETMFSVQAQIESMRNRLSDCARLQSDLPAGAARNALDCALWDLQCQQSAKPVWQMAGQAVASQLTTAFTLSLDAPKSMAAAAKSAKDRPLLKLKLAGDQTDAERVLAISQMRPDAGLILDGNEGFCLPDLQAFMQKIQQVDIRAIEQPLPAGKDDALAGFRSPFVLCADESLHTRSDLGRIAALYDMVNIKLDKTGGLTEALALLQEAKTQNLQIMVGCMVATSLSMAPALILANSAELVDLDGPLLLDQDRQDALQYEGAVIQLQPGPLWGYPRRA